MNNTVQKTRIHNTPVTMAALCQNCAKDLANQHNNYILLQLRSTPNIHVL